MVRVAGEDDHRAGRIGFQLTRVQFITQSDIKHAGNHATRILRAEIPIENEWHVAGQYHRGRDGQDRSMVPSEVDARDSH